MATGPITQLADVIVPEMFNPYVQQLTEEKSRIIASGALVRDGALDAELAGGGLTFHTPSFKDLDNDADNVGSDEADDRYTGALQTAFRKRLVPRKKFRYAFLGTSLGAPPTWRLL